MGGRDFADIRKFGRDVLDINTHTPSWKEGFMGKVYNKDIYIGARPGWISVRDSDGKVLVHADPDCIVRFVMTG
jgi:hypothetical protein